MKKTAIWDPKAFKEHFEMSAQNNIILSELEKRKLKFYLDELKLKKTDVVLDAGCGYGRFSKFIKEDVGKVIGIDINPQNIEYAKEYVGAKFEGHVVDLSLGVLPFNNSSIDKVIIDNVLTFLNKDNQISFFKELRRIIKDDGIIVFNIDNSNYVLAYLSIAFNSLYKCKAKLKGKTTPVHHKYPLSFYEKTLSDLGFSSIKSIGDSFYRKMGIGPLEVFPKFLHKNIVKLDNKHHNTQTKKRMSTLTIAASLS